MLDAVAGGVFRTNPGYELAPFDSLDEADRNLLSDVRDDPDMFGLLRPRGRTGLRVKVICRVTAELFGALQAPGVLPADLKIALGPDYREAILKLVLDGVLQMQIDGEFRSGGAVYAALCDGEPPAPQPGGRLARLSVDALRYGQALDGVSPRELSARLYFFNRLPLSPRWRRTLPDKKAVADYLGIETGIARSLLGRYWHALPPDPQHDMWFCWMARRGASSSGGTGVVHKLYVSPAIDSTRRAVAATIDVLSRHGARMWKCGADASGVLRPDKIVAYFDGLDALGEAAERLRHELDGCPVHGVPFTAECGGGGLLSWGVDPPRGERALLKDERQSWRLWLTNQLTAALLGADAAGDSGLEPWQYALRRVEMDGVDIETWSPRESIWGGNLLRQTPPVLS
jgi:hypothetical protein